VGGTAASEAAAKATSVGSSPTAADSPSAKLPNPVFLVNDATGPEAEAVAEEPCPDAGVSAGVVMQQESARPPGALDELCYRPGPSCGLFQGFDMVRFLFFGEPPGSAEAAE